jgi:hypothetical protein
MFAISALMVAPVSLGIAFDVAIQVLSCSDSSSLFNAAEHEGDDRRNVVVQQLVKNSVPLCGTNRIHGARKSATVLRGSLTAVYFFSTRALITPRKDGKQPPDRTRPGPERIRHGSRKLEAVRTSRSPMGIARRGYPKSASHGRAP